MKEKNNINIDWQKHLNNLDKVADSAFNYYESETDPQQKNLLADIYRKRVNDIMGLQSYIKDLNKNKWFKWFKKG